MGVGSLDCSLKRELGSQTPALVGIGIAEYLGE
jgi:hypothetical protein